MGSNKKMKISLALVGIATASTIVDSETKVGCGCCKGSLWGCAGCCISHCTDDATMTDSVRKQLESIQGELNENQVAACGSCAICFLNGEDCDQCNVAEFG